MAYDLDFNEIIMVNSEAERVQCLQQIRLRYQKGIRVWVKDTSKLYMLDDNTVWQDLTPSTSITSFTTSSKWQDF